MSRALSTLGMLGLVAGILLFPASVDGETTLRWPYLIGGLALAALCFWGAAKVKGGKD